MHVSVVIYEYIYIHSFFLKKKELLFNKSFKLKIFFQNFFPMHAVLRLKCPNALLPSHLTLPQAPPTFTEYLFVL